MRAGHRRGLLRAAFALFLSVPLAIAIAAQSSVPCSSRPADKPLEQRCAVTDQAEPPKRFGGVDDAQYCFEHVSDADRVADGGTYRHWLTNWHATNILDADWRKADIQFTSIAPRDCVLRLYSSGQFPREDTDAPVRYGRIKDKLTLKNATAYVPDSSLQTKPRPSLTGSIYAGLLITRGGRQERFVVDVATRSEFKGAQLSLQVENRGDSSLIYSVADLAGRIGKERFNAAVEKSAWKRIAPGSDWFQIPVGTNAPILINDIGTAAEEQVRLQFAHIDAPNTVLGQASVPVYVPGPRSSN